MHSRRNHKPVLKLAGLMQLFRILVLVAAALAFWGWYVYDHTPDTTSSLWSAAYKTLQTYIFEVDFEEFPVPLPLMIAVFLAPLSLAGSIVVYYLRITSNRLQAHIVRWTYRDHIVVIGDTPASRVLVETHNLERRVVFVVPPGAEIPQEVGDRDSVVVIQGEYTSVDLAVKTRMDRARAVLLFPPTAEAIEDFARTIVTAYGNRTDRPIRAAFAVDSGAVHQVFSQFSRVLSRSYAGDSTHIEFSTFSLKTRLARVLAERVAPHASLPEDRVSAGPVHLVVHGFGPFVEAVVLESAQLYHYSPHHRVQITIISDDTTGFETFITRNPGLPQVVDISRRDEADLSRWVREPDSNPFATIPYRVVILSDDGWEIPRLVRDWRRVLIRSCGDVHLTIPVTCVLSLEERLTEIYDVVEQSLQPLVVEILPLRDLLNARLLVDNSEEIDSIARPIHESYRKRYGMDPWEALSDWQKTFNRRSAAHLKIKLWFLGFALSDGETDRELPLPAIDPERRRLLAMLEHRRWVAEKLLDDFVPGTFPDDPQGKALYKQHLRIHGDIRPFEELKQEDIRKDEATFEDLAEILRQVLTTQHLVEIGR